MSALPALASVISYTKLKEEVSGKVDVNTDEPLYCIVESDLACESSC